MHPADAARRRGARRSSSRNMRNPDERRGDLRAQLAAHRLAERRVEELVRAARARARRGRDGRALRLLGAASSAPAIARLPDGRYEAEDVLEAARASSCESGARSTFAGDELAIDFAGTPPQHAGNLNCPLAVTRSACYFVVRCLTDPDVPASGGAFAPVTRRRRPRAASSTRAPPAAVVAGNVETSSPHRRRRLRARFGRAVAVPAQGQGTMNNVALGNERFTYYETIGGGQGACPDADGPSGVHVAMSNTLNTPVEALELAYPLRVERYALRLGSGGAGAHRGGDGVVRELRVLEPCRLSLLTRAPAARAARRARRRPRRARAEPVNGEELPAKATRDARRRRRRPDRDARRRRPRRPAARADFVTPVSEPAALCVLHSHLSRRDGSARRPPRPRPRRTCPAVERLSRCLAPDTALGDLSERDAS